MRRLLAVLANTPASSFYFGLRDTVVGPVIPGFNHLQMSIGTWAADGLLVVFFFLTGLELKKEFVIGDLKSPSTAIIADCGRFRWRCGARDIIYGAELHQPTALLGWAIPTATDIAFAVSVLCRRGYFPPPRRCVSSC